MQVYVRTLSGRALKVEVEENDPIEKLKKKIHDSEMIPPNHQRIVFKGKVLEDEKVIGDYDIEEGSNLHLLIRMGGGYKIPSIGNTHTFEFKREIVTEKPLELKEEIYFEKMIVKKTVGKDLLLELKNSKIKSLQLRNCIVNDFSVVDLMNLGDLKFISLLNVIGSNLFSFKESSSRKSSLKWFQYEGSFKKNMMEESNFELNRVFQEIEFPELEYLSISIFNRKLDGVDWKPLSPLTHLKLFGCLSFGDDFFVSQPSFVINNLENITLRTCSSSLGEDSCLWGDLKNLRILDLENSLELTDELFEHQKFGNLEILRLCCLSGITGSGWKSNLSFSLKELDVNLCRNFGDELFQENEMKSLEKIRILGSFRLEGKEWKKFQRLEEIFIGKCFFDVKERLEEKYHHHRI